MPELVRYHGQVTAQSNSNLQPVASRTVLVTRRGATINETAGTQSTLTVHAGATRFAVNDYVVLEDTEAQFRQVSSITNDTTLVLTGTIVFADGDRLLNLGNDTATGGTPDYDGATRSKTDGNWNFQIFSDPNGDDAVTNNRLTTDSDGEYAFYAPAGTYDITVLDSSSNVSADSQTLTDVHVGVGNVPIRVEANSDDSQEEDIQDAIDLVSAQGGGVVELGPGTFTIDAAIEAKADVWVRGQGMNVTIVKMKANTTDVHLFQQTNSSTVSFFRMSDLTLDGNQANITGGSSTGQGTNFRNINTCVIENVECKNTQSTGLQIQAFDQNAERGVIRNCYVHDVCTDNSSACSGIIVGSAAAKTFADVIIENNILDDVGAGNTNTVGTGINVDAGGSITQARIDSNNLRTTRGSGIRISDDVTLSSISNNTIVDSGQADTGSGGNGIFISVTGSTMVSNNTIDGVAASSDNGIEFTGGSDDVVISNNKITGVLNSSKFGIFCGNGSNSTLIGNSIHDNTGGGIDASTSTASKAVLAINGNTIDNNGGIGIRVKYRTDVSITGNVVKSNGNGPSGPNANQHGIFVSHNTSDSANVAIGSNTCVLNTGHGITCVGTSAAQRLAITGNVCHNNEDQGMFLQKVTGSTIVGNFVEDNDNSGIALDLVQDCIVASNVVKGNGTDATGGDKEGIILQTSVSTDVLIDGNMILDHSAAGQVGVDDSGLAHVRLIMGNNNFFNNNTIDFVGAGSKGADIASASTITLGMGRYFDITGTADIDTITASWPGRVVTLQFDGTAATNGVVNASNLELASTFAYSPLDTLTLVSNGTNWFEVARSANV